jgi:hypothetical protein
MLNGVHQEAKVRNPVMRFSLVPGFGRVGAVIGLTALLLQADTVTLRNGSSVQGTYLGGTARQVRIDQNGDIRTFDIGQVQSVIFDGDQPPPPPPPPPAQSSYPPRERDGDRNRNQPQASGLTIPIDTQVTVRMIESVNSETSRLGQTYRASLDEPIYVNGQELVPRGADVLTKLVTDQQSGKIEGRTVLTLALSTITVNGRTYDVTSSDVKTESSSRGARSGKVIGGTAALGAIIGGIAGGGKGAAIGAGSGAAVGTGAEVLTGGQKVKIPSETRLTFRLQNPVQL